ncbi:hypothetical protein, partial [Streptomyces lunaelactis]
MWPWPPQSCPAPDTPGAVGFGCFAGLAGLAGLDRLDGPGPSSRSRSGFFGDCVSPDGVGCDTPGSSAASSPTTGPPPPLS